MRADTWEAVFVARTELAAYIDALWSGRLTATASMKDIFTERLAVAAKLSALLRGLRSIKDIVTLVRDENGQFPRDVLATDAGRNARAAFNLLARAVAALDEHSAPDGSIPTGPESLVGEQLSSVEFVMDYIQLGFDGQFFQVLCPLHIHVGESIVRPEDDSFRNVLCGIIGQIVHSVDIGDAAVIIRFEHCRIDLLYGSDDSGRETLNYTNRDRVFQVFTRQN